MGTEKRARQKEQSRTRAQSARQEAEAAVRRKRLVNIGAVVVVLAALIGVTVALTSGGDDTDTAADGTTTTEASATSAPADGETTTVPAATTGTTACPAADGSSAKMTSFDGPPQMCIDPAKTYAAEVETNQGSFTIEFDAAKAPATVNNFVFLARYHYFDGIIFHRIIKDFVIQGGDPEGTGTGGPGYEFADELPQQGEYEKYSVAMANSGPNTNGSQFFIITGDQGVALPPSYSLFGKVVDGRDVVDAIGQVETDSSDKPTSEVTMEKVTITES